MGRPRSVSDEAILAAVGGVVGRVGPARLTLAEVAGEVGLSPAALVKRFGSKRGLLVAYAERGAAGVEPVFARARAAHASPLAALHHAVAALSAGVSTPAELANHMGMLQADLVDPELHRHALAWFRELEREVRALLDEAVDAGELARCDTARLARAVDDARNGAMIGWAIRREGRLGDRLREAVETVLAPYARDA